MAEPLGEIEISEDVVANIASNCAARTPGVVGLSGGFVGGISKLIREGFQRQSDTNPGVKAEVDDAEKTARVDLSIAIQEGNPIPTVASALQHSVKETVEKMTGLRVLRVDIHVRDIVPLVESKSAEKEPPSTAPREPGAEEEKDEENSG
jgi:uncharacterized alkaline shock family protein YloU